MLVRVQMHSSIWGGIKKVFFLNFFAQSPPLTPRMKKKLMSTQVALKKCQKIEKN